MEILPYHIFFNAVVSGLDMNSRAGVDFCLGAMFVTVACNPSICMCLAQVTS